MDLRDRLSIEHPVLQAGMGAGIAGAELAVAVTNAGGLGTVGTDNPQEFERAIERTKSEVQGKPYAANLLIPFFRTAHVKAVLRHKVPIVSMFYGFNAGLIRAVKESGAYLIYQIGSEAEADRVVAAGADALIVQGFEAGGHIRGKERLASLLPKIRDRYKNIPVIAAGGIWDRQSAAKAMAMGADGVSSGTRFLMTNESGADDKYKRRLVDASETVVTTLFGLGWPAPHRVLINEAVRRWCDENGEPRAGIRILNWLSQFGAKYTPPDLVRKMTQAQRADRPFFTPQPAIVGIQPRFTEAACDYAGECVREIAAVEPARSVVRELAAGC